MRILLTGRDGQLGRALSRALPALGELRALSRAELDISDEEALLATLQSVSPQVIVNAAAYTAVDRAEQELDAAQAVNAQAPAQMAEWAASRGAILVHFSTDYVFDGAKPEAYVETDEPCPLSAYGHSKLAGEEAIRQSGCNHLIFRTSWVFSGEGSNFVKTILRLASERETLRVVTDQIGSPTSTRLLAEITCAALSKRIAGGTYHAACSGSESWHGFARQIVWGALARGIRTSLTPDAIEAIASRDYPQSAQRPLNSRLNTQKLSRALGLQMPPWQDELHAVLDTLCSYDKA